MPPETTPWGHAVWLPPDLDNRCAVAHMTPLRLLRLRSHPEDGGDDSVTTIHAAQFSWPPAFRSAGRQRAVFLTASVQFLLTVDTLSQHWNVGQPARATRGGHRGRRVDRAWECVEESGAACWAGAFSGGSVESIGCAADRPMHAQLGDHAGSDGFWRRDSLGDDPRSRLQLWTHNLPSASTCTAVERSVRGDVF